MFLTRALMFLLVVCSSAILLSQQKPTPANAVAMDFPLELQQGVTAGKTAVGTKIQGKLIIATLVAGTVVPRNAVFSGEVTTSEAKTATSPSRLAIRVDSVRWKNGSASLKAYLSQWYYPPVAIAAPPLQYGPQKSATAVWNGQGEYPDANATNYHPFPNSNSTDKSSVPDASASTTSSHRMAMRNVESAPSQEGGIALTSKRSNIKLEKFTTYVFSQGYMAVR
jgi:hypothetical protein